MKKLMAWNKCYGFEAFEVYLKFSMIEQKLKEIIVWI